MIYISVTGPPSTDSLLALAIMWLSTPSMALAPVPYFLHSSFGFVELCASLALLGDPFMDLLHESFITFTTYFEIYGVLLCFLFIPFAPSSTTPKVPFTQFGV